jgi:hypothetical protein
MRVREDCVLHPDGSPGLFGVVEKPDFALIVPVDSELAAWTLLTSGPLAESLP